MAELTPCSALRGDKCFNGFMVTPVCHGPYQRIERL